MNFEWIVFINLGIISSALIFATWLRTRVVFLQKFLIPNALVAGFILLPFYNFVFPRLGLTSNGLGALAYHLLSLSFVALALKAPPRQKTAKGRIFNTTLAVLLQYAFQGLIGLLLTLLFINTIRPDLFHSFGYLLPLGFAQGPGQAFSIGQSWSAFGVENAGNIGLTFAAIGFLLCSFGGIFIINYGIRHKWICRERILFLTNKEIKSGILPKDSKRPVGSYQTTETEAIDSFTINIAFVFLGYFATFLLLKGLNYLLSFAGKAGEQLAATFWGLSFIFAALVGLLIKQVLKKTGSQHIVDNLTLNRISGFSVDLMVTSAIAAISLVIVSRYWFPIFVITGIGAVVTAYSVIWFGSRIFTDHRFLRTLLIFGVSTGTLSTGLALLRVVDPEFETPVATDYTYASGLTFAFAIPYVLTINLPLRTYTSGNPMWFWAAVGINLAYLIFVGIMFSVRAKGRIFNNMGRLWYPED